VNEEVVDLVYEVIDASVIVIPDPREKVVDCFFRECSRSARSDDVSE
jgi:hypothetical protein